MKNVNEYLNSLNESLGVSWYIMKVDEDGEESYPHKYDNFDKNTIQKDFDNIVDNLTDEEEAHFMRDTKKYIGEYILSVVNQDGKLKREITKGSKIYYKPYKGQTISESVNENFAVINEGFKYKIDVVSELEELIKMHHSEEIDSRDEWLREIIDLKYRLEK